MTVNTMYNPGLDPFAIMDSVGTTGAIWLGSMD